MKITNSRFEHLKREAARLGRDGVILNIEQVLRWGDGVSKDWNGLRSFPAKRNNGKPFTEPDWIMPELQGWFASINTYYPNQVNMLALAKAFWNIHPLQSCNTLVARLVYVWACEYFEVE